MTEQEIKQELLKKIQYRQENITIILLKNDDKYYQERDKRTDIEKAVEFEREIAIKQELISICIKIFGDDICPEIKKALEKGEDEGRFNYNMRKAADMCPSASLDEPVDFKSTTIRHTVFGVTSC